MTYGAAIADRLGSELTIDVIREKRAAIADLPPGAGCFVVDCSSLARVDVSGLQLLASIARSAALAGGRVDYENRSEALAAALERAGLRL